MCIRDRCNTDHLPRGRYANFQVLSWDPGRYQRAHAAYTKAMAANRYDASDHPMTEDAMVLKEWVQAAIREAYSWAHSAGPRAPGIHCEDTYWKHRHMKKLLMTVNG
eukprot:TRINITY_DN6005_c0_g1_i1.p2 TRINITY_DN6005_c0_g1~~TRINITY_DN6005_c0_g1_i1.p2  ORF type:complete len:107 (-),score=33.70 TRINITY_DN6005_c0_g1_i1:9-329(-)